MSYRICLFLTLIFAPLFAIASEDPFASSRPDWRAESLESKPYQLEILFGLVPMADDEDDESFMKARVPSQALLSSGQRVEVAVSADDLGRFAEVGSYGVDYAISEGNDRTFDLQIYFKSSPTDGGYREINTEVTLALSDWVILGGMTRANSIDGKKQERNAFTFAVRITQRGEVSQHASAPKNLFLEPTSQTAPAKSNLISLKASGDVYVLVKDDDTNAVLFGGTIDAGDEEIIERKGPVNVVFTKGEHLTIIQNSKRTRPSSSGAAKITIP